MRKTAGPVYFFGRGAKNPLRGISPGRRIALFLDFDGTLVPIRKDPARCVLSPEAKGLLQSLADSGRHFVTVLSGRALDDIKSRVGIRNICYGGNHGLAISGKGIRFVHPGAARVVPIVDKVERRLEKEIAPFDGAWVERKKFTFSLHYRLVNKSEIPQLKKI
ncbi:MAG: trehalose-phosphatase, partial [Nitrospiraceae bacterium]|nr:trehalose-phosphatase [Nitrospiraceae bacterium]